jgi:hypothetical protein
MLLSGCARVDTRRENIARLDEMRAAETAARKAKRGVWSDRFYAIHTSADVARSDADSAADPVCIAEKAANEASCAAAKSAKSAKTAAAAPADATDTARPQRPRRQRDFQIVEGQITRVAERERAVFPNFADDITRDFWVLVPKDALETWPGGRAALTALQGQTVRVRGDIGRCGKPLMRVDFAQQIEVAPAD